MTALISKLNITTPFFYICMVELRFRCFEYYHVYRSGNTFNECLCVVLGVKSVAPLTIFHLLQWEAIKVKFLINSNMTLTVLNLHQKADPKVQQDFKGQGHYDKVKSRSYHDADTYNPNQCPYQASTSYTLRFPRYSPDKIL